MLPATMHIVMVVLVELARHRHRRIFLADLPLPDRQRAVVFEDDARLAADVLIEEQPVVFAQRQISEPRAHFGLIENDSTVCFNQSETKDITVEIPKAPVVAQQLHRDQLADEILWIELGVIGQYLDNESEIA